LPSKPAISKTLRAKLGRIRCLVMDVDGVLTDGRIILDARGVESKAFDVHDGYGIVRAQREGMRFAIISGRKSAIVRRRAAELGIRDVALGVEDKGQALRKLFAKHGLATAEVCSIGDDEPDLAMLAASGVSAAPSSAVPVVRASVDVVTAAPGGRGAVRELLDLIRAARGRRAQ
jgi:3-deoxy-D-manno-octulosonate 8-phosphate phosphatase (KDO 8-P phosphatase)